MKQFLRSSAAAILFCVFLFSCSGDPSPSGQHRHAGLMPGTWRGVLNLGNPVAKEKLGEMDMELPFIFEVIKENDSVYLDIINAEERIRVDEIAVKNDSVFIQMPVFDSEFRCRFETDSLISGVWINHSRTAANVIPFRAVLGDNQRFFDSGNDSPGLSGNWKVVFEKGTPEEYLARGEFKQDQSGITGTFLTETGDYRYLDGGADGGMFRLSAFDGSHAFLFGGKCSGGRITDAWFISGIHHAETWSAEKNDTFSLRKSDGIVFLKEKSGKIDFSLPDENGKIISLSDKRFQGKAVIIQIMGAWCPNCLDEAVYLSELHKKYHPEGLEIIALDFERVNNPERTKKTIAKLKKKTGIPYDVLISDKLMRDGAKAYFPMLSDVTAFPTTIFIDRKGKVKTIHTGFSGPGTGSHYVELKREINALVEEILKN